MRLFRTWWGICCELFRIAFIMSKRRVEDDGSSLIHLRMNQPWCGANRHGGLSGDPHHITCPECLAYSTMLHACEECPR